jgi:hypothetical protein
VLISRIIIDSVRHRFARVSAFFFVIISSKRVRQIKTRKNANRRLRTTGIMSASVFIADKLPKACVPSLIDHRKKRIASPTTKIFVIFLTQ